MAKNKCSRTSIFPMHLNCVAQERNSYAFQPTPREKVIASGQRSSRVLRVLSLGLAPSDASSNSSSSRLVSCNAPVRANDTLFQVPSQSLQANAVTVRHIRPRPPPSTASPRQCHPTIRTSVLRTSNSIVEFDVCVTVHRWYNNINNQLDATSWLFTLLCQ